MRAAFNFSGDIYGFFITGKRAPSSSFCGITRSPEGKKSVVFADRNHRCCLMGMICGANDIMSAYLWAQHRKNWFVSMGLCLAGLPSCDTLNRVLLKILGVKGSCMQILCI